MDRDRIGISKTELFAMLEVIKKTIKKYFFWADDIELLIFAQKEDELKNSILCVFANKQDIEGAMTASEVANSLGKNIWVNNNFKLNWSLKFLLKQI